MQTRQRQRQRHNKVVGSARESFGHCRGHLPRIHLHRARPANNSPASQRMDLRQRRHRRMSLTLTIFVCAHQRLAGLLRSAKHNQLLLGRRSLLPATVTRETSSWSAAHPSVKNTLLRSAGRRASCSGIDPTRPDPIGSVACFKICSRNSGSTRAPSYSNNH